MAKQTINIGSSPNDGTGTTLRDGGDLINDNFNEIYTAFGDGTTLNSNILTASSTDTLTNKTINSASNTITITESNISDLGAYITASSSDTLTNKTISASSNTITNLSTQSLTDFDYGGGSPSADDILQYSGASVAYVPRSVGTVVEPVIDSHLNTSTASSGEVLSWNGSDYDWVAQSGGDVVDDTTPQLGGNLDLNSNDITGTGNINTTGNITASGDLTIATNLLYVDSNFGLVGIGTSSPFTELDVRGNIQTVREGSYPAQLYLARSRASNAATQTNDYLSSIFFSGTTSGGTNTAYGAYITVRQTGTVGSYAPADMKFYTTPDASTYPTEKLTIKDSGDVGIGTNTPTEKLDISGNLNVSGSLTKGSGTFRIDHPLPEKTTTHHLVHSFVESPQANNIYRGKVTLTNGQATVNLDTVSSMTEGTFVLLNRDIHCYTSNETDWDAVKGSINENILTIQCQNENSTATVSWLVIGERQDQTIYDSKLTDDNGKIIVEPLKTIQEVIVENDFASQFEEEN